MSAKNLKNFLLNNTTYASVLLGMAFQGLQSCAILPHSRNAQSSAETVTLTADTARADIFALTPEQSQAVDSARYANFLRSLSPEAKSEHEERLAKIVAEKANTQDSLSCALERIEEENKRSLEEIALLQHELKVLTLRLAKRDSIFNTLNPEKRFMYEDEVSYLHLAFGQVNKEDLCIHRGVKGFDPNDSLGTDYIARTPPGHLYLTKHYTDDIVPKHFDTADRLFVDRYILFSTYMSNYRKANDLPSNETAEKPSRNDNDTYEDQSFLDRNKDQQETIVRNTLEKMDDFLKASVATTKPGKSDGRTRKENRQYMAAREFLFLTTYNDIMTDASYIQGALPMSGLAEVDSHLKETKFLYPGPKKQAARLIEKHQFTMGAYQGLWKANTAKPIVPAVQD